MKKFLALGLALGLGLLLADGASAQIRMGVGGPMTGGSAAFGAQLRQGVEQAVADINAQGGILGQKIELFIGDDRANPREGVSVANKFVADGVKFVVGHFNSGVTMPASEVYQENGILAITPAATNPKVTERSMWNMFRVCGRDDQQGDAGGARSSGSASRASASPSSTTRPPTARALPTRPAARWRRRPQGRALRRRQQGRPRLHRAGLEDPAGARRPGVLGRTVQCRRPDRAPDARAGPQGAADGRRRHHRRRVRGDRRPRCRGHADDVLARSAHQPSQQGDHRAVPLEAHVRAAGLYPLQLRRGADLQAGRARRRTRSIRRRSPK